MINLELISHFRASYSRSSLCPSDDLHFGKPGCVTAHRIKLDPDHASLDIGKSNISSPLRERSRSVICHLLGASGVTV